MEALMNMILEDTDTYEIRIGQWEGSTDDGDQTYFAEAYEFDPDGLEHNEQWVQLAAVYGADSIHLALIELAEKLVAPESPHEILAE